MSLPGSIKRLDENVVNRIAAGEVIQRPSNALKELIENSLDARSTNIQITVKNGGLKLLQIQDNGTGIRKDDFGIVCERFTTSKLTKYEDLSSIGTYGFRGEALASISHIAHLNITSKTATEICAYTASYIDGNLQGSLKPVAGNQGTIITVEDLFYNMHVRKASLRSASEEYQKISEVVGKYSIHNALVGFSLKKSSDKNDIRTPPKSNSVENIRIVYGNAIARELIECSMENASLDFKSNGYITNVNYSTKKFLFLLFINHRLVDCQSLKKCIDQVYSTYLPKNTHPFVYLNLEINPKHVDVNIHPTKHEVHFLNEEQIVESIVANLEIKLLGSNNSRIFYTQAKLPGVQIEPLTIQDKRQPEKIIYSKELVRTDANEQKLEKFFGAPVKKNVQKVEKSVTNDVSLTEQQYEELHQEFLNKGDIFEDEMLNKTTEELPITIKRECKPNEDAASKLNKSKANISFMSKISKADTQLTSVLELRKTIENNCHLILRETFAQHVFVGVVDPIRALIQYSTKLYLCDTQKIMEELMYEYIIYNFQNFGTIKLSQPIPIYDLAIMGLDLADTGWTEEDGPKEELAKKIVQILTDHSELMQDYFSLEFDKTGNLISLPLLLDNYTPEVSGLPMYILRLATDVNWDSEKECFESFARETAVFYSRVTEMSCFENNNWKWIVEHIFYTAIKDYFIPPKQFTENAAILEIANLPNLYKVFERC